LNSLFLLFSLSFSKDSKSSLNKLYSLVNDERKDLQWEYYPNNSDRSDTQKFIDSLSKDSRVEELFVGHVILLEITTQIHLERERIREQLGEKFKGHEKEYREGQEIAYQRWLKQQKMLENNKIYKKLRKQGSPTSKLYDAHLEITTIHDMFESGLLVDSQPDYERIGKIESYIEDRASNQMENYGELVNGRKNKISELVAQRSKRRNEAEENYLLRKQSNYRIKSTEGEKDESII
jgi:hypothetical protein